MAHLAEFVQSPPSWKKK